VKVVNLQEIAENNYSLNIPLYVEKKIEDNLPSVEEALLSLKDAFNKTIEAEEKMKEKLKELGLLE